MSDLEPCPMCGSPAKLSCYGPSRGATLFLASCSACSLSLTWRNDEAEATAAWNRRAPSAEEARLRAEVASLRATLGQQPAVEGAEPIGCPLPGACGAVRAHAAAYRAGAEAMREAAAVVAQTVRVPHMNIAPDKYAIGVEIAAAIRALPLPAGGSGWRPIETAPIDQEIDIWVARSEDGHAYSHGYRQERVVWNATEAYWEGERTAIFPQQATHWQPLPAAPEDTP